MATPSFAGILMVLVSGGGLFSGGGLLGLPPGERDAAFVGCAPADALIYSEWAARSKGEAGAPGIDGLAADPEIRAFIKDLDEAILKMIAQETEGGQAEEQVLGRTLPPLIKALLMRPGCLYAELDSEKAAKALEEGSPLGPAGGIVAGLRVTLIVNAGDQADALAKQIDAIIDLAANELPIEKTENLQQQKIPLPLPGGGLTIHRHNKYFIVGFGEGTVDAAIAGLDGKSKGIKTNERFAKAMQQIEIKRTGGVMWVDVKGLVTRSSQALGLQGAMIVGMAKMVGADAIDSIASCTGVIDGQIRTRNYITTGGKTEGILALAAGRAIKPDDFSHIPADADFVFAGSVNVPKVLEAARQIVGNADPQSKENLDQLIQQLETELGVSFTEDIFKAFGDLWTMYDSPSAGGLLVSAPVLSLEVRDGDKAKKVVQQLLQVLENALPGELGNQFRRRGVFLEETKFMDHTLHFINTIGDDVPVAPTLCLTDKQLLIALHPQPIKAHLRFLASGEKTFAGRIGKDLKLPEGDLLNLTYVDSKTVVRIVYGMTPWFGQLMFSEFQREGFEMNIASLPSGRAILPYLDVSLSTVVRTPDGIMTDSQSALPIPGGSAGFLTLPMSFLGITTMRLVPIMQQEQRAAPAVIRGKAVRKAQQLAP